MIIIKETIIELGIKADYEVHPVSAPIEIWSPEIIKQLYAGCRVDFYTTDSRNLSPLIIGIIAINIMVAKAMNLAYPNNLIEQSLWNRSYVNRAKKYLFTETGLEASLRHLNPTKFTYIRTSEEELNILGSIIIIHKVNTRNDVDRECIIHGK